MRTAFPVIIMLFVGIASRGLALDARFVQVGKTIVYSQNSSGAPVLQTNAFEFQAKVEQSRVQSIGGVSVKWPSPGNPIRALADSQLYWSYSQRYPTIETMNLSNPNGTYTFFIQSAGDGNHTNILTLSADIYPNPVHVANFTAAQSINARTDFTLQWDSFGAGDMVQVRIFVGDQVVFETGSVPGAIGTLSGTATSAMIPRNTLREGTLYRGQVVATRRATSDSTGYPGVPAWATYSRRTEFPLRASFNTLDVNWFGLAKLKRFSQASTQPPVVATSGAYGLTAFAFATDSLNLQSASFKAPSAAQKFLAAAGPVWRWSDTFETQQQLDSAYTTGNYEVALQTTHNGNLKLVVPVTTTAFPGPPQISNWNDSSAIDSKKPFTLKWAVPGGSADDFVQVIVRKDGQVVLQSPEQPFTAGALNGQSSAFTIPAGLLQPGESAEVTLTYLKSIWLDPFSYPQALGVSACGCETKATIRALGGNLTPPTLNNGRFFNGAFVISIAAMEGRQCIIQTSTDFQNWSNLFITNAPAVPFDFKINHDPSRRALGVRVLTN